MTEFRVVTVTNNLEAYPLFREDTEEFPNLVKYVEDEAETFIVDTRDGGFWGADEFFACESGVKSFFVDSSESPAVWT